MKSKNVAPESIGEKLADKIAAVGGSWAFILAFVLVLVGWITINSSSMFEKPFDPYPFILLNLALSCLAALQAPIIMMSQNRQAAKDRVQAAADYETNVRAEEEIRKLNDKIDQMMKLLDVQKNEK